jgi:hypothetical protein
MIGPPADNDRSTAAAGVAAADEAVAADEAAAAPETVAPAAISASSVPAGT